MTDTDSEQGYLLVADDNEMNRDMLSRRLAREGYRVAVAEDGEQTLALLENDQFDLVLLDVEMPGLSGFEVLQVIRRTYSLAELPVIMATAHDTRDDVVTGFKLGANDYVTKPIDFPVLLVRVQTQLQLKNLTRLKDQFLQIASHDLKNPLANVLTSAHLILQLYPTGATVTDELNNTVKLIVRQGKSMQRIISDFLDFRAIQDGQMRLDLQLICLNPMAYYVLEDNADYARSKGIEIQLALDDELPECMADEARLVQVMQNLVGNAIKFCREGAAIRLHTFAEADRVVLEVCDSGPGLTEADLTKVFTKYARLSNAPTGGEKSSGLGLAICKQIVEAQGGTIGVRNNPDQGATFWFSLPIPPLPAS
ncbi:MAG TPA: response regulator [Aggregatilineales bacterium]|nr:response regulator [Aggregatilineales bacterium]